MGCFSWTFAERTIKVANLCDERPFKFLIPQEFGGGFIQDHYTNYGNLYDSRTGSAYDMYEILAFWNADHSLLKWDGDFPDLKTRDQYTDHNRLVGIRIGCYDEQIDRLKYPIKIVPASSKTTYESCHGYSYTDPNQGWDYLSWDEYDESFRKVLNPAVYPDIPFAPTAVTKPCKKASKPAVSEKISMKDFLLTYADQMEAKGYVSDACAIRDAVKAYNKEVSR